MLNKEKRYNDLNGYLRSLFGCRVQKITVDAGLSCPNRDGTLSTGGCTYCNADGSGTGAHRSGLSITGQIERGKVRMARRYNAKKFIAYFQSFSNTYAPVDTLKGLYDEAMAVEDVAGLFVGTRPDCVDGPVMDLLQGYTKKYLVWLELGLQSAHDETLQRIGRGHDLKTFEKAVTLATSRNIKVCVHLILGLPGENRDMMLETAKVIAETGIEGIKLHHLYVIKGTKMEEMYREGTYRCLEQQEYADLVCDVLELLPEDMIIQRLTGDPHAGELVAPAWSLRKWKTLDMIAGTLAARNSWQGKLYDPERTG